MVSFGYHPDDQDTVDSWPRVSSMGLVSADVGADLSSFVRVVRDQGPHDCCVGAAIAAAIELRGRVMGINADALSECAIWTYARNIDSIDRTGVLQDLVEVGCRPASAFMGIEQWGLVAQEVWPLDAETALESVPWDVLRSGYDLKFTGAHRVGDFSTRIADLKTGLSHGYPAVFAMKVDDVYTSGNFGVYDDLAGKFIGWHYQTIVGYQGDRFKILNSWGSGWCQQGYSWVTEGYLASLRAEDFYLITAGET